jgi:hypothetical protein
VGAAVCQAGCLVGEGGVLGRQENVGASPPAALLRAPASGNRRGPEGGGRWRWCVCGINKASFTSGGFDFAHSPPCDHKVPGLAFRPRRERGQRLCCLFEANKRKRAATPTRPSSWCSAAAVAPFGFGGLWH